MLGTSSIPRGERPLYTTNEVTTGGLEPPYTFQATLSVILLVARFFSHQAESARRLNPPVVTEGDAGPEDRFEGHGLTVRKPLGVDGFDDVLIAAYSILGWETNDVATVGKKRAATPDAQ